MKPWLPLCRIAAIVALSVSAALYVQYLNPIAATFCGLDGGCEAVRSSGFAYLGHRALSIPLAGILAYTAVLFLSLRPAGSKPLVLVTGAGAVIAVGLLAVQAFAIGTFCSLCVVVDASAIFAAAFAFLHHRRGDGGASDPLAPSGWLALALVAAIAPVGWSWARPLPPVPGVIRDLYVPGKINVVEFADFECPFCRALHPILMQALSKYPAERVHFVRMNVPLDMHPNARPAARAYICAQAQGKGEALAGRLIEGELDEASLQAHVRAVGLDRTRYRACVTDSATDARIARETQRLEDAGLIGLPTTYVGGQRFIGVPEESDLHLALELAAAGQEDTGIPAPVYWPVAALAAGGVVWWGRRRRAMLHHGSREG